MKKIYTCLLLAAILLIHHQGLAQKEIIRYLTESGYKEVPVSEAYYFEIDHENETGGGTRTRFLLSDSTKVSLNTYKDFYGGEYGRGVLEGPYYVWYKNGQLQFQAAYSNNELTGEYKKWYDDGKLHYRMNYEEGLKQDSLISYYESGAIRRIEVYANGELISGEVFDESNNPMEFFPMEQMPVFPGGDERLIKWLSQNVSYPRKAYKAKAAGIVIITFIVEKDGKVGNVEVIKSVHPDLDAEAIRVVKYMPKWKPGLMEGEPTRVQYSLPLKFSLL